MWLLIIFLACGGGIYWLASHKTNSGKTQMRRNRAVPALTDQVRVQDVPVVITALGTVTPTRQVTVHPRVDGLLQAVHFKEGALVTEGSALANIDPRPFAAALATAKGQLAKDEAQLENAKRDLDRYRKLMTQDSISRQVTDTQTALVKQLQGTVDGDKGTVATAQLNLSFTTITSPISGVAGLRQIDPGNMVHASDSTGLVVLTAIQPIDVVFTVPEEQMSQVLEQRTSADATPPLKVALYGRDDAKLLAEGQLLAIDNQIDANTGTTKLKARFANTQNTLFPGQFVNVRLTVNTLNQVTTVMQSAVQHGTSGYFVYAVTPEQTIAVRQVQPGPTAKERIAILKGLEKGETVVIDGADRLKAGSQVTTIDRTTGATKQAAPAEGHGGAAGEQHQKKPSSTPAP